ncbi:MAG TPA: hypothetical protein VE732_04220 [Nitrososphaera sp.]|jgi:hypothetical protein|nr:hypothetical protein [Nitrososphaera sp.]
MISDFFRDPIWQFIGAVFGLIAIGVSVYLFVLQKSKKSLCYRVLTQTPLLAVNDEIKGKLQILYEGVIIQGVHLLVLKVICNGNVPIKSSDFEQPLTFSFGDEATILSMEVVETSPKTLNPQLQLLSEKMVIQPVLLNNQDTFTIKLLIAQYNGKVDSQSRIIGVREVREVLNDKGETLRFIFGVCLTMLIPQLIFMLYAPLRVWLLFLLLSFMGAIIGVITYRAGMKMIP